MTLEEGQATAALLRYKAEHVARLMAASTGPSAQANIGSLLLDIQRLLDSLKRGLGVSTNPLNH